MDHPQPYSPYLATAGVHSDWNIRFPRSVRELGILYVCDEVVEASAGGSYIAQGEVKRLIQ